MNKTIKIIIAIVGLALIGWAVYANLAPRKSDEKVVSSTDMTDWKTYSNPQVGIEVKYPVDWNVEPLQNGDLRIYNPAFPGKADTDVPSEDVHIFINSSTPCKSNSWEKGFADANFKTECISGKNVVTVGMRALTQEGQQVEELILASLKTDNNPAPSSLPTSQTEPIAIIYPAGGENLKLGTPTQIKWKNTNTIYGGNIKLLSGSASYNIGLWAYKGKAYDWIVGEVYSSDYTTKTLVPAGQYRIRVCRGINGKPQDEICDESNLFTITPSSQTLSVVSPNGGEKIPYGNIFQGGDLGFTWKYQVANNTPTAKFSAFLIDENNTVVRNDFVKAINPIGNGIYASSFPGEYQIQINKKYKVRVCDEVDVGVTKCDESDNYFTITN